MQIRKYLIFNGYHKVIDSKSNIYFFQTIFNTRNSNLQIIREYSVPRSIITIMAKARVSACVITFCKEDLIEDCLKSVKWADEIIVVDSYSTDKTVEICRKYTDKVYQRKWTGFRDQRNYAMDLSGFEWILFIDSDERISPELYKEIQLHLSDDSNKWDGFHFPRQTYYMGKWINHGDWYPSYCLRLYRKDKGRWVNEPHERLELN